MVRKTVYYNEVIPKGRLNSHAPTWKCPKRKFKNIILIRKSYISMRQETIEDPIFNEPSRKVKNPLSKVEFWLRENSSNLEVQQLI